MDNFFQHKIKLGQAILLVVIYQTILYIIPTKTINYIPYHINLFSFFTEEYERILNQKEERHSISEIRSSTLGTSKQDLELADMKRDITNAKVS